MKHSLVFGFLFVFFGSLSTITYAAEEPEIKRSAPIPIPVAPAGRRFDWKSIRKHKETIEGLSNSHKPSAEQRRSPREWHLFNTLTAIGTDYVERMSQQD
ncbi:MAG: hypothetical protein NT124_02200 [Candidatus Dependentiae bacterium]|nr:hypothetical protein [Candidatus Dependentiae bacterium]